MMEMRNFMINWVCILSYHMINVILDLACSPMCATEEQRVLVLCEMFSVSVGGNMRGFKASEHVNFYFNI